jgi:ribosomal protein L40E
MLIQDCVAGQRIRYRETGRLGTIKNVHLDRNEVDVLIDGSTTSRCHPRLIELTDAAPAAEQPTGPQRACPSCAAKMPADATTCPKCGFQYGLQITKKSSPLLVLIIALLVAAVAAVVVWKLFGVR